MSPPTPPLARELSVARRLAREAGQVALAYYGQPLAVEHKRGNEPVTRADREANQLIVEALRREFPSDAILAEETPDDRSRFVCPRVWMIDPIDGTRDFIRGRDGWAVMIGLLVEGRPALGVVYQPTSSRVFFATRGGGAFAALEGHPEQRIHTSDVTDLSQIRLVASKSHRTPAIDAVRDALGIKDEQNVGSVGLKLGLIACGLRDLYVNPSSRSSAWDTCAPEIILVEAGGRLTDLHGRPIDYQGDDVRNLAGLVASNGVIHELVLEKIRPLFPGPLDEG